MLLSQKLTLRNGMLGSSDFWYSVEYVDQAVEAFEKDIQEDIDEVATYLTTSVKRPIFYNLIAILQDESSRELLLKKVINTKIEE